MADEWLGATEIRMLVDPGDAVFVSKPSAFDCLPSMKWSRKVPSLPERGDKSPMSAGQDFTGLSPRLSVIPPPLRPN